ncbi:M1 family metallopeptidase [Tenacibaculum maritimum]|uniref:M1 family metallopeptidase n=1 Tax=Tenacibaculum maritimum TaxID=107401 RepID=UPI000411F096|nr:M1 family metallopeptidase [Tenacibaculum maritimum]MCD9562225.1 M1 family metallopeptidase [Tenacibaculum maritimum]MCD9564628.1 M1 family metallopeptidase [Tenacibaculum maritimum]MCD9578358.1 M1 family metallopeptidase [Tenacibaculum maritimum]MCD9584130.1 M1 family metallopeptidase [Tenacibaculum maritimum]MCD9595416.1 M1 family metallopeptidase [Tenacibaculum maritimum]
MKKIIFFGFLLFVIKFYGRVPQNKKFISNGYWQQHVDYTMDIDMDVETFRYQGKQTLIYTNNSPDVLKKVYYHLYFNAFQPNSQMDIRSRNIKDPDGRVKDRISKLLPSEIGYIKVKSLKQNGINVRKEVVGTILEVTLNKPIKSGEQATFEMLFEAQVPKQIRRSGRNNSEGVALSMTQWYPKMAEYDFQGWHTPPYLGREFHGVWGNFDVTLHIDKNYVVGGSGYVQNPQEVGHGYENKNEKLRIPRGKKLTWKFKAPNVHDFTWAADPEYTHDVFKMNNGIDLHFLYKKTLDRSFKENWKKLQPKTAELINYFSKNIGQYPYKQYSVIQGGDGGMEYAMCTLITGKRKWRSLFGVTAHEIAHTWFQFLLATNESLHPWMDEGFTTYVSNKAENEILRGGANNPHEGSYRGYHYVVRTGTEEPLSTHADRYDTNRAYGIASYSKGNIFLSQLEYIIGEENVRKTLKKYFDDFAFKHPTPNDIQRTAEKVSGIHLGWYLNEWTQTTHTIDYGIRSVEGNKIILERIGKMPMPIDVEVVYKDGTKEMFNIPLRMMRGEKPTSATILEDWTFAHPTYTFATRKAVKSVTIDPSQLMADIELNNNTFYLN